jgi:tetratricopeptide (TPR) repeat protein
MNRDELLFDKIEAWLRGKLPPAEAAAFEAEMAANADLAALVKKHRLENQGLEWLVERDLLAKMNAWEREVSDSSGRSSGSLEKPTLRATFVRRWRWAAGVAAMLAIAFFGWWLLRPQEDIGGPTPIVTVPKSKSPVTISPKTSPKSSQKPPASQPEEAAKNEDVAELPKPASSPAPTVKPPTPTTPSPAIDYSALAATYYREGDFMQKTNGNAAAPGYGQALDSYKSGKYADVEKLLKPSLKSNPNALKEKELLAHSLYKNRRYDEAIPYFRDLSSAKDKALAERSEWALALTLLHKMPAQKPLLTRVLDKILADPSHAFYAKAKELKKELGN